MSPSSDIETLFGHFGGNAGDYQEIGRENEASTARTRWPLLVTLDLTQPSIPAVPQRREHPNLVDASQAQSAEGEASATPGAADAAHIATPTIRSKAPLFTRPHRRSIPPVEKAVEKVETPRGAERFSAIPQVTEAAARVEAEAQDDVHAVPPVVMPAVPPVIPPVVAAIPPVSSAPPAFAQAQPQPQAPVVPPVVVPVVAHAAPAFRQPVPPVMQPPLAPVAAPAPSVFHTRAAVPAPAAFTARAMAPAATPATWPTPAPAAPVRPAPVAQPQSILGKLFNPAASNAAPAAEPAPAALGSLFNRLRGDTPTAATPAPHSWLNKGSRRS